MTIWAIVPVKPLRRGKSRLSSVLTEDERANLNRAFLENTLKVLRETPEVTQALVVSRDPAALAIAREYDARTLLETGMQPLNSALTRATEVARIHATRGVLVIPADLPLLTATHISELLALRSKAPCVLIAPDRHKDGTNALFQDPAGMVEYAFGTGSFHAHCQRAQIAKANLIIHESPVIGLDLDTPEDLKLYHRLKTEQKEMNHA
jgi:2-phospho-L-lactate/phosphoenolpyruvate guanylyltransferase